MIEKDFQLLPIDEEIKLIIGNKHDRILKSDRNLQVYENAKKEVTQLAKPLVGWNRFKIKRVEVDKVVLDNDVQIGGGPVVDYIKGSDELLVALITIGQDVECRVKHHMNNNAMLQGILLDGFATWAVDNVRKQFLERIKRKIHAEEGCHTSIPLSPGETAWTIHDQKNIFQLLKEESIQMGVYLRESLLMIPLKSITFIMGIGKNQLGKESGRSCDICTMRDKCRLKNQRNE